MEEFFIQAMNNPRKWSLKACCQASHSYLNIGKARLKFSNLNLISLFHLRGMKCQISFVDINLKKWEHVQNGMEYIIHSKTDRAKAPSVVENQLIEFIDRFFQLKQDILRFCLKLYFNTFAGDLEHEQKIKIKIQSPLKVTLKWNEFILKLPLIWGILKFRIKKIRSKINDPRLVIYEACWLILYTNLCCQFVPSFHHSICEKFSLFPQFVRCWLKRCGPPLMDQAGPVCVSELASMFG
ncbi:hypothetical protein BpHYR1_050816 [Brachionus plicatilis]|uniref:Uncharacterized protein n=1 Tax=Brachionus plicatilis TaxID=10195 RepID=A0A3M7T834_BRAPC|nr:hypothetical protein BpHYR1_050816 [Brachionus plicatilis]